MAEWVDTQFGRVRVGSPLANLAEQINNPPPLYETPGGGFVSANSPAARFYESGGFRGLFDRMFPNASLSNIENLYAGTGMTPSFGTGGYAAPMPNLGQMSPEEISQYRNLQGATAAAMLAFLGGGAGLAARGATSVPGTSLVPYAPGALASTAPTTGTSLVPYAGGALAGTGGGALAPLAGAAGRAGTSLVPYTGAASRAGTSLVPYTGPTHQAWVTNVVRNARPALGAGALPSGTPASSALLRRLLAGTAAAGVAAGSVPIAGPRGPGSTEAGRNADAERYQGLADMYAARDEDAAQRAIADEAVADFLGGFADGGTAVSTSGGGSGYRPTFVDTSAAESVLPLTETEEERAALMELLEDLGNRASAGIEAVRTGWDEVRRFNESAAMKARQMAVDAGPEAAGLWISAANNALLLASQTAQAMGQFAGMQNVNISPTSGVANTVGLMLGQAPRAQALAERLGLISAEDIASQGRTAAMMGESYAGDIQRTSLIMAQQARQAHNQRVMDRIAANRTQIATIRASAATENARIANSAAQFAASQVASTSPTPQTARERLIELDSDIRRFSEYTNGEQMLMQLYPELDVATASALLNGFRSGSLGSLTARGLVESGVPAPEALVQGGFTGR